MKKFIIALITIAVLYSGCSLKSDKTEYGIYTGIIECEEYNISNEISGRIDKLYYDLGDTINKGQIVAELNKDLLYLERKSALAQVEVHNAKLEEALAGSRSQEIEQANFNITNVKANIKSQEEVINILKAEYEDMLKLKEAGGLAKNELNDLRIKITSAQGNLDSLYEQLKTAHSAKSLIFEGASNQSVNVIKKTVSQAQTVVEITDEKIDKSNLHSYHNGTVISVNAEEGEIISSGFSVMTIADIDNLYSYIFIPEKYLSNVSLGKKVKIYSDADDSQVFEGVISYISHKSEFTPRNVETKEEYSKTMFKIKVDINNGQNILRPGMMIDIKLF